MIPDTDRSLTYPVMFFVSGGAVWLLVSILLGAIASAKIDNPDFLATCSFFTYGRVFPAHLSALIYGWGMQAAFAVILWLMARLCRNECGGGGTLICAGLAWNLGVAAGIVGILTGNGTGMPWMEFPAFVWPVLLVSYVIIVCRVFIQFRVRAAGCVAISQWYLLAAILWFPWIYTTANVLLHCLPGHPLMAAGINAWYQSSLVFLFFMPVGLGAAYALSNHLGKRPVPSNALAMMGFWSLAVIAPWAGMQKLIGAPVPYFLPYFGAAATVLMFLPFIAAATNIIRMVWSGRDACTANPARRFIAAGMVSLVLLAFALLALNVPDFTLSATQFTLTGYGFDIFLLYGFFSFVMFGVIYCMVPLVTGFEWPSARLVTMHWMFSVYGIVTLCLVTLFGGFQQGIGQEDWHLPWISTVAIVNPYAAASAFAWALILFSNICFLIHLSLLWQRIVRRAFRLNVDGGHCILPTPEASISAPGVSPMSLRIVMTGLVVSFAAAWVSIIVIPYFKMRDLAPIMLTEAADGGAGVFIPKRSGRVADGAAIYAENGCYLCHTQIVRPTYAGNDLYRPDWAGLKTDPDRGDTRRETNAYDFYGETFAQIGVRRVGPDLSNIGGRVESYDAGFGGPSAWLYAHLYNPRTILRLWDSACPPHPFLFERREIKGNKAAGALQVDAGPSHEWLPNSDAKALVSYLLSLKKDQKPPAALNFAPRPSGDAP